MFLTPAVKSFREISSCQPGPILPGKKNLNPSGLKSSQFESMPLFPDISATL